MALPYGVCRPGALVSERVFGHSMRTALLTAEEVPAAQAVGERLADWLVDLQSAAVDMPPSARRGLHEALPQLVAVASTVPSTSPRRPRCASSAGSCSSRRGAPRSSPAW